MSPALKLPACNGCGATLRSWGNEDGPMEGSCKECDAEICERCCGFYEADYSLEGESYRDCSLWLCKTCKSERDTRDDAASEGE